MRKIYFLMILLPFIVFGGCKKDSQVTVVEVKSLWISENTLNLLVGDTAKLTVSISPSNTANKVVKWASSDSTVASVDDDGLVLALSAGSATISAASSNGIKAECGVTVVSSIPSTLSSLKVAGKYLINEAGDTVMLRGTNLGSWLVQEDWMTGNVAVCQKVMIDTLTERFGSSVCQELIDLWEENWIKETDIDNIKNLGFNCIRVPFTFMNLVNANDYSWKSDAFKRLDWIVRTCGDRKIYVILDMHGAPGSQNGSDHSGIDGGNAKEAASEFFFGDNAPTNQAKYYEIWEKIAHRYAGNATVAGYDLLNEPFSSYRYSSSVGENALHSLLYPIYDEAYRRIRVKDPNHMIIMEATWDPWDLPNPSAYSWTNVMYEYHNYLFSDYDNVNGQQISSMTSKLNNIRNYDNTYKVPNLMGEFCFMNSSSAWEHGLALLNSYGVHWTSWNYKVQYNSGNWGIYNCPPCNINTGTSSESEIRSAWGNMTSARNTTLANILSTYATGKTTY